MATDVITETPTKTTVFMARRRNLVLVRRAERKRIDNNGDPYVVEGERHEFREGRFETSDPDLIDWLRAHPRCGDKSEGFFEVEPPAPAPNVELVAIAAAAARLDVDGIAAILTAEHEGHERPLVIETAESALAQIKAIAEAEQAGAGG